MFFEHWLIDNDFIIYYWEIKTNIVFNVFREWKDALENQKTEENKLSRKVDVPVLNSENLDDSTELKSYFHCDNSYKDTVVSQRGNYYAIYNFVKAEKEFRCTESVTLSAPGDYRYLVYTFLYSF